MVYKKKFIKKTYKKGYKRTKLKMKMRMPSKLVHSFKRKFEYQKLPLSTVTAATGAYLQGFPFYFNAMYDAPNFASLYELYRINAIKFELVMGENCFFEGVASGYNIHTAVVYNNSDVTPPSLEEIQSHATYKKFTPGSNNRTCVRYFIPKISVPVDTAGSTPGRIAQKATWTSLTLEGRQIRHHGIWFGIEFDGPVATTGTIQLFATYYMQCKYPL